jgi:hypothetical protein
MRMDAGLLDDVQFRAVSGRGGQETGPPGPIYIYNTSYNISSDGSTQDHPHPFIINYHKRSACIGTLQDKK